MLKKKINDSNRSLGGSGTRAIAEVLIQSGVYMGDDLNGANDNLVFTRLFKNPDWYKSKSELQKQIRINVFEKYMTTDKLSAQNLKELYFATKSNPTYRSTISFYIRALSKLFGKEKKQNYWGWKEPNTQIYMSELLEYFDDLKYIHVLRHGLDMAFSDNKQQLNNWGWKYNIILTGKENEEELAVKQLDYWIESTKDVVKNAKKYGSRCLFINHGNFCNKPIVEIDKLLKFVGINVSEEIKEELYKIPKNTGSNNRYINNDLSIFESQKLEFVKDMGFEI